MLLEDIFKMDDITIKKIKIIKHPRKIKMIINKLENSKNKSNDIKKIIIRPHQVVKGDHKYYKIKKGGSKIKKIRKKKLDEKNKKKKKKKKKKLHKI